MSKDHDNEGFKARINAEVVDHRSPGAINVIIARILLAILVEIRDWRVVRKEKY